jgi:hypothetical protein
MAQVKHPHGHSPNDCQGRLRRWWRLNFWTARFDRRTILSIDPDPGTGVRTATNTVYDFNGRVTEVDKGTTNAAGTTFTALETTLTAFDPNGNKTWGFGFTPPASWRPHPAATPPGTGQRPPPPPSTP